MKDKDTKRLLAKGTAAVEILRQRYPEAECSLESGGDPWRLLVMARLSAQCTDERVNQVTPALYAAYPTLEDLAKAERRRTRAEKEWAATVPKGGKPSFTHPLYQACVQLDRTVMEYREALGLTPKALRRVRGADAPEVASGDSPDGIAKRLDAILARAEEYDAPMFELNTSEAWAQSLKDGEAETPSTAEAVPLPFQGRQDLSPLKGEMSYAV